MAGPMKLIVGLGNPGTEYAETWHNLGFMIVDRLFERACCRRYRAEMQAEVSEANIAGIKTLLVKPMTYMNLSGNAVFTLLEKYGESDTGNLMVAADDIALPFGFIRIRRRGSAGGQKGLKSIIERLGSVDFSRVRLGIMPDHPVSNLTDYVLSSIHKKNREKLEEVVNRAADAFEMILAEGVDRAMSVFNERVKNLTEEALKPEVREQ